MGKLHSEAGVHSVVAPKSQEREKTLRPRKLWHGLDKNWDRHVAHAEALSHTAGFEALRDMILEKAEPAAHEQALDVGAGTGLLTLDLATSNYCFHHLGPSGKREALAELHRVLKPGGRLVFADMMFTIAPFTARDRTVIAAKFRSLARRGPAGLWRLARAGLRTVTFTGEHPAPTEWWQTALAEAGFVEVVVEPLAHEGGIAVARKPR